MESRVIGGSGGSRFLDIGTGPGPGLRESNDATASGLSGRSRKVELAGTAKSAWKSKRRNASDGVTEGVIGERQKRRSERRREAALAR